MRLKIPELGREIPIPKLEMPDPIMFIERTKKIMQRVCQCQARLRNLRLLTSQFVIRTDITGAEEWWHM